MDKQRLYDAMLIKAFRQDIKVGYLYYWLKPLGIEIPDKTLKRQPPTSKIRVQAFVGIYLKPLADRLWDTDSSQDIKTLDWMVNLETQRTSKDVSAALKRKSNTDRRFASFLASNHVAQNSSGQWNVTKGKVKTRRIK